MEIWLWAFLLGMIVIIICLLIKIRVLQKTADEIKKAFEDKLLTETNTLIDISSGDRFMRGLANSINGGLCKLREERHRLAQGDMELKNAVTNISHDLRTPLTAICGYLDLLEQEEKSKDAEEYLRIIRNRAELLTRLTEELFQYSVILSGGNSGVKETVAINGVLEESIAAFYTALKERGIVPDIHMPEKKVLRTLDRSALTRVFSNLLNNAVKYSDGDLDITLSENGDIVFSNRASGLNEVQTGKLFNRFYTVESGRKSTGLGLAIAKTLTLRMNGRISAGYKDNRLSISVSFPEEKDERK